jgi:hypothetical protein
MLYPIELRVRWKGGKGSAVGRKVKVGRGIQETEYRRRNTGDGIQETGIQEINRTGGQSSPGRSSISRSLYPSQLGTGVVFAQCFGVSLKHANDFAQGFPQRTCVAVAEVLCQD